MLLCANPSALEHNEHEQAEQAEHADSVIGFQLCLVGLVKKFCPLVDLHYKRRRVSKWRVARSLTAVDALMECSRPHLPRRRFYRPRLLWVGCGSGTEALSLFAMHRGGGRATLVEHVAELARAAHLAVATRAGKPQALIGEELVMNGWHVRVITANILEQQPEFFVGFNIVYTFAGSTSSTRSPAPRTTPWRGAWPRRPGQLGRSW